MLHFNFIQFQCCGDASLAKVIVQTNIILSNVYTNILDLRGVYKPRRLMRRGGGELLKKPQNS